MERLELRLDEVERRVTVLEKFREKDLEHNTETREEVGIALQKMDNLIDTVKKLPEDIEQSISKSFELMQKEHESIYQKFNEFQKNQEEYKKETDQKIQELQDLIEENTTKKDAKTFNDIKEKIITVAVTAIVTAIVSAIIAIM